MLFDMVWPLVLDGIPATQLVEQDPLARLLTGRFELRRAFLDLLEACFESPDPARVAEIFDRFEDDAAVSEAEETWVH